jgi:hypothetical protein
VPSWRRIELIEFLALINPGLRTDHSTWATSLANPDEPFDPLELDVLPHTCHDQLTRLQGAVMQDGPLPRLPRDTGHPRT